MFSNVIPASSFPKFSGNLNILLVVWRKLFYGPKRDFLHGKHNDGVSGVKLQLLFSVTGHLQYVERKTPNYRGSDVLFSFTPAHTPEKTEHDYLCHYYGQAEAEPYAP
jgi:hypothetical protein